MPRSRLKPAEDWFKSREWKPFPFQRQAWSAYLDRKNVLLHSATGTGKTLGAWMGPLLEYIENPLPENVWSRTRNKPTAPPLVALWVTPLRALAGDTVQSLQRAVDGLNLPWVIESRTGDSTAATKARQRKKLPTALVTTPESLTILLSYAESAQQFRHLRAIVVDEWHELIGSKRGVLLELALSRLKALQPEATRLGLSATLGNLDESLRVLTGPAGGAGDRPIESEIIHGLVDKKIHIRSTIPEDVERFPWAGHLGIRMIDSVVAAIESAKSSLVFTNTRNQTELWYQELLKARPDWAGQIALHHGSLDGDVRTWVEEALRNEKVKAVVCTSSLDLGVDFTAVDQVIQVGSPKGIARLLQRAGRSGHQPGADSKLVFVPTNALELVELAAAKTMMERRQLESREPVIAPLDLLAQHAVTRGLSVPFSRDELLGELRTTHSYATLSEPELDWALAFAKHGGESLKRYTEFHRLVESNGQWLVADQKVARRHRMAIGTIVSDVAIQVRYMTGKRLGTVEESFISKISPGDRFLLAGKILQLVRFRDSVAYVKKARGTPTAVPRWSGGRMPLSSQLSLGVREKIEEASRGVFEGPEMQFIRPLLELHKRWSSLPTSQQLLIERIKTRDGYQLFIYPFEGRLVHEGLAAIVAYRLSRGRKISFSLAANDYGFVLQSPTDPQLDMTEAPDWFSIDNLLEDIHESLNETEMAKRHFREVARISGLIHSGYPGQSKQAKHLQASSDLYFDVFCEYDPENMLLAQARHEVLQKQLEWNRLNDCLVRIEQSEIVMTEPDRPTPLAFPLLVDRLRERLSTESLADRVRRMQLSLEKAAG
jgi:ATP-dependent Lhr-like helicase